MLVPSSRPFTQPSHIPTLQPSTYNGILNLNSVSPEGQVAVVSFVGMSVILAILGMIYAIQRKSKSSLYKKKKKRKQENSDEVIKSERSMGGDELSIFHKLRVLGGNSDYDSYVKETSCELNEKEDEPSVSSDGDGYDFDSLHAMPPLFNQPEEIQPTTWSMTSEGAVITHCEEHVYEAEQDLRSHDQQCSLESV